MPSGCTLPGIGLIGFLGREGKEGELTAVSLVGMLNKAVKRPHPPELTFPACVSKLSSEVRFEKADGVGKGRLMCFITVS